jgi:hypothetical protein
MILLTVATVGLWPSRGAAAEAAEAIEAVLPLHVLYVGNAKSPRADDYLGFLRKHFKQVTGADRERFDPSARAAKDADVVLLDWSQSETDVRKAKSPLGKREDWSRPTVLLGSAGLLLAGQWQLIGGAG